MKEKLIYLKDLHKQMFKKFADIFVLLFIIGLVAAVGALILSIANDEVLPLSHMIGVYFVPSVGGYIALIFLQLKHH